MTIHEAPAYPPTAPKQLLYREQLTQLFRDHGLPPLQYTYLAKISSLGSGPPVALIWYRRPMYDAEQVLAWMRERMEQQTKATRERYAYNKRFEQERRAKMGKVA